MNLLVIWRRLSKGGINVGWRNRAKYFHTQGITTDFLFLENAGGAELFKGIANIYILKKKKDIIPFLARKKYHCIIIIDYKEVFPFIQRAKYKGKVIIESRVPIKSFLIKQYADLNQLLPSTFIVPSNYQKSLIKSILKNKNVPVKVIYNSIDTKLFKPLKKEDVTIPCYAIGKEKKKIIAWVGAINTYQKNWQLLLKVAYFLTKKRNDIHFWIIGNGTKSETTKLVKEIERLRLVPYITWIPSIPYESLPNYYNWIAHSGGCLFSTTKFESFGNVFTEAMACNVPVVAPKNSAIVEIIKDNYNGKLYKTKNKKEALIKINELLDRSNNQIVKQALKEVNTKFATDVSGKQYADFLKNLK